MPNIAWEVGGKVLETLPWERSFGLLSENINTGTQTTSHAVHKIDEV